MSKRFEEKMLANCLRLGMEIDAVRIVMKTNWRKMA